MVLRTETLRLCWCLNIPNIGPNMKTVNMPISKEMSRHQGCQSRHGTRLGFLTYMSGCRRVDYSFSYLKPTLWSSQYLSKTQFSKPPLWELRDQSQELDTSSWVWFKSLVVWKLLNWIQAKMLWLHFWSYNVSLLMVIDKGFTHWRITNWGIGAKTREKQVVLQIVLVKFHRTVSFTITYS
jgi:hypothetical protein